MARLYLDEDVHEDISWKLREKGHDVQTSNEAGNSNKRNSDSYQLNYATENNRVIITNNRRDFNKEHIESSGHKGVISGNHDKNLDRFASQIDAVIKNNNLENVNIRANTNDFVAENKVGEKKTYTYDQPTIDPDHIQRHQSQALAQPAPTPAAQAGSSPSKEPSPAVQAQASKSISDYRRGDDQAQSKQKQEDNTRQEERLSDRYRRPIDKDKGETGHQRSRGQVAKPEPDTAADSQVGSRTSLADYRRGTSRDRERQPTDGEDRKPSLKAIDR